MSVATINDQGLKMLLYLYIMSMTAKFWAEKDGKSTCPTCARTFKYEKIGVTGIKLLTTKS